MLGTAKGRYTQSRRSGRSARRMGASTGVGGASVATRHSPRPRDPLAQCNAAARALGSPSSGLFAGHFELHAGKRPWTRTYC